MPSASFQARFAPLVLEGSKLTTIREGECWKVGDRFCGFYGMRTPNCVRLIESIVRTVDAISIHPDHVAVWGSPLKAEHFHALACGDGFPHVDSFLEFFRSHYPLPFHGQIIGWEPRPPLPRAAQRLQRALRPRPLRL